MPITESDAATAGALMTKLTNLICALESHPQFDTNDPCKSSVGVFFTWGFVRQIRHDLNAMDLISLEDQEDDTLDEFHEIVGRTVLCNGIICDPSGKGYVLQHVTEGMADPVEWGPKVEAAAQALMPDRVTGKLS